MNSKVKVFRIVTSDFAVKAHLTNTLDRIDSDLIIYVIGDNVKQFSNKYPHVTFVNVPIKRKINLFYDLYALLNLIFHCLIYKPTVIHTIMPKAGLLGSIAGYVTLVPKRFHTFTGQVWTTFSFIKRSIFIKIDQFICLLNTENFTDSLSQSNFLFENKIMSKKNTPLPFFFKGSLSGVDLLKFSPLLKISDHAKKFRKELKLSENDFIVLYMARKTVDKGALDFLKIVKELNNNHFEKKIKFLFIGPDESDGKIDDFFLKYPKPKNLINIGKVDNHQNYIAISDILCMPSHKEGFGSIVIDCASMGVPCIGYDIVGLSDAIVNNKTGILIEEFRTSKFANEIINFYENKKLLNTYSENCIVHTKNHYDADLFYKKLKSKYLN